MNNKDVIVKALIDIFRPTTKKIDPRKNLDPRKKNLTHTKNVDPSKKYLDPRNPRNS